MSVVTIIQEVKQVHPEYVVMTKVGKFYKVYGKDSYILSYLLNYKVSHPDKNCETLENREIQEQNIRPKDTKNAEKINILRIFM